MFHLPPDKTQLVPDKYVQALIVPIQSNLDHIADETSEKGGRERLLFSPVQVKLTETSRGQSFVILPPREPPLDVKQKESGKTPEPYDHDASSKQTGPVAANSFLPMTYVRPPPTMESGNRIQQSYQSGDPHQSYTQPTAIRIVVRNPVDGTSREVFSTSINTGNPFQSLGTLSHTNHRHNSSQNKNKVVIIALPRDDQAEQSQAQGSLNSRSSTVVNTYYQPTSPSNFHLPRPAEPPTAHPPLLAEHQPKLQYIVPKIPYSIPIPSMASQRSPSSSPSKSQILASSTTGNGKTAYTVPSPTYYQVPPPTDIYSLKQNSRVPTYEPKQVSAPPLQIRKAASTYNLQRRPPARVPLSGEKAAMQHRLSLVSQHAKRKHSAAADGTLGELSSYTYQAIGNVPESGYSQFSAELQTSFSCYNKAPGYYPDVEEKCQVRPLSS